MHDCTVLLYIYIYIYRYVCLVFVDIQIVFPYRVIESSTINYLFWSRFRRFELMI